MAQDRAVWEPTAASVLVGRGENTERIRHGFPGERPPHRWVRFQSVGVPVRAQSWSGGCGAALPGTGVEPSGRAGVDTTSPAIPGLFRRGRCRPCQPCRSHQRDHNHPVYKSGVDGCCGSAACGRATADRVGRLDPDRWADRPRGTPHWRRFPAWSLISEAA